jgi:hypothetical protein
LHCPLVQRSLVAAGQVLHTVLPVPHAVVVVPAAQLLPEQQPPHCEVASHRQVEPLPQRVPA